MLNMNVVQTLAPHSGALGPVPGDFRCHSQWTKWHCRADFFSELIFSANNYSIISP